MGISKMQSSRWQQIAKIPDDVFNQFIIDIRHEGVDCVVTSPPYWRLRDYGIEGHLGKRKNTQVDFSLPIQRVFNPLL